MLRDVRVSPASFRRSDGLAEDKLDAKIAAAERRSGRDLADLNLYYIVEVPSGSDPVDVADRLNGLDIIELAEPQPRPSPPPVDLTPPTSDMSGSQTYKTAAPSSVGALDPVTTPGGDGTGMAVVDVEYEWTSNHEDIELPASANIDTADISNPFGPDHGTAVLGEIGGKRNGYGITGIAPGSRMLVAPANTVQFGCNPARAIGLALDVLSAGDVILIEQQTSVCNSSNYGPVQHVRALPALPVGAAHARLRLPRAADRRPRRAGDWPGRGQSEGTSDNGALIVWQRPRSANRASGKS